MFWMCGEGVCKLELGGGGMVVDREMHEVRGGVCMLSFFLSHLKSRD
jgi:hypothetical protein